MQVGPAQFDAAGAAPFTSAGPADARVERTELARAADARREAAAAEARRDEQAARARRATGVVLDAVDRLRRLEDAAATDRPWPGPSMTGREAIAGAGVPADLAAAARTAYGQARREGPSDPSDGSGRRSPEPAPAATAAIIVHPLRWRGTILDVVA